MRHDPAARELVIKIVYCGPGMAGKSTNMAAIRRRLPADRTTDLVTRDMNSERSIHFSWRADEMGQVHGHQLRVELHTIPGQSYYAATRRQLLEGVDGIVFVADSRREALDENIDAMNELLGNLRQLQIPQLPIVLQYNKQDMPTAVPAEQLAPLMNPYGWPTFAAAASEGRGVAETLQALLGTLRDHAASVDLPEPDPSAPPASWLLTCWRCQNMVDVPSTTAAGQIACPVCKSSLEIVDADRGITRAPVNEPTLADLVEAAKSSASTPATASSSASGTAAGKGTPYLLEGYTSLGILDRSPQGVRTRIRANATGRTFRALALSEAVLALPGYRQSLDSFLGLAGDLQHPGLLPVTGVVRHGNAVIVLSEDPEGYESLGRILSRRRALAPPHALGVLRGLALALDEAARRGLIHGWLRPEVILLNEEGGVLLDELGIPPATRFLVQEQAGESAATEYYLSPEYLQEGVRPDVQSDIFLMGALFFRMVTSEGMVTGYNAHEALHRILTQGPRRLREAQPGLSRELDAFHQRLAAATPAGRFRNHHELLDALDRFGGGAKRQDLHLTRTVVKPAAAGATPKHSGPLTAAHRRATDTSLSGRNRVADGRASQRSRAATKSHSRRGLIIALVAVGILAVAGIVAAVVLGGRRSEPVRAAAPAPAAPNPVPQLPDRPAAKPAPQVVAAPPAMVPVAAPPATVPLAAPAPTVAQAARAPKAMEPGAAAPTMDPLARRELMTRIADLTLNERFGDALKAVAKFTDAEDRTTQQTSIEQRHDQRRAEIEAMITQGVPTPRIAEALTPARTLWDMPGDEEWASTVMARASTRHLSGPVDAATDAPVPVPVPVDGPAPAVATPVAPQVAVPAEPDLSPVVPDPAVTAQSQVVTALRSGNLAAAQAVAAAQTATPTLSRALHRLTALWQNRLATITRVITARSAKMRLPHPTTGEPWDVVSVAADRVAISAPNGSASELSWSQVPIRVQARLWTDAASAAGAGPVDHATAMAMNLLADENTTAALQLKRVRPALVPEVAADLDLLMELNLRRTGIALLNRGVEAVRTAHAAQAGQILADLRRTDRSIIAGHEDILARLERLCATQAAPAPTKPESNLPKDLRERQAALRTAGWDPIGNAYLDGLAVVMPAGSGISSPIPAKSRGFGIGVSGTGFLRIIPTRPGGSQSQGINIPLPAEASFFTVNITREGVAVLDAGGKVVDQLRSSSPSLLIIRATGDARMPATPQPLP